MVRYYDCPNISHNLRHDLRYKALFLSNDWNSDCCWSPPDLSTDLLIGLLTQWNHLNSFTLSYMETCLSVHSTIICKPAARFQIISSAWPPLPPWPSRDGRLLHQTSASGWPDNQVEMMATSALPEGQERSKNAGVSTSSKRRARELWGEWSLSMIDRLARSRRQVVRLDAIPDTASHLALLIGMPKKGSEGRRSAVKEIWRSVKRCNITMTASMTALHVISDVYCNYISHVTFLMMVQARISMRL